MQLNKTLVCLFLILSLCQSSFGQTDSTQVGDSTQVEEPKKKRNTKFLFALDARRSFVLNKKTKFNGFKIGVIYKERHKFGLAFYGIQNPIILPDVHVDKNEYPDASDTVKFNFDYSCLFYEPIWFKSKRWQLSTPFQFGAGSIKLSYRNLEDTRDVEFLRGGTGVAGVSGVAQFKILRWLAVASGAGYRFILIDDKKVRRSISAPIYNFSVKILAGELFKMAFRRKKLEEW